MLHITLYLMGEARKTPDPDTLTRIARHEAGHAVIGWLHGHLPIQVTVVGRSSAGGYVEHEIEEEKIIYTRKELEAMICRAMGGRAAELLYYGDAEGLSTGVAGDLQNATRWAERMVREFGMSSTIGQVYFEARALRDGPVAAKIAEEAERIVRAQLDRALEMLRAHRAALDRLAEALVEKNRLTQPEVEQLLDV